MNRTGFKRYKACIAIINIGHVNHGKTTLTNAIAKTLGTLREWLCLRDYTISEQNTSGITINKTCVEYETASRRYFHIDSTEHADYVKNIITGREQISGSIVVISAVDGVMPQTREQMMLAHQVGILHIVVFINKKDLVDEELLELAKFEVRELLSSYGFSENGVPIVAGSALLAVQAMNANPNLQRGENKWVDDIYTLIDAVETYIPEPQYDFDKPFFMPVEDVFEIKGYGIVITGLVEQGRIKRNDTVEIVGIKATRSSTVNEIKLYGKSIDEGLAGDNLRLLLEGIRKDEIERGMAIASPGSITAYTQFDAEVYILNEKEKGELYYRYKPLFAGNSFEFYFRTIDVAGTINSLMADDGSVVEWLLPGERIMMSIQLQIPIAMEQGVRFAIRKDSSVIGAGVVYKMIT